MKSEVLQFLKNLPQTDSEKFNKAFELLRKTKGASFQQVRVYNTQGASPQNIKNILYDLKKLHSITDAEVLSKRNVSPVEKAIKEVTTALSTSTADSKLKENTDASKKTDLHKEFPFLSAKDCPAELHIVTGQLVASWKRYNGLHAQLQLVISGEKELPEEKLLWLTKETNDAFELNDKLYKELEYYRDNNTILAAVDSLKEYALKKEIEAMSIADLVKEQKNAASYLSKQKKELEAEGVTEKKKQIIENRIAEREFRLTLVNKKLGVNA